MSKRKYFVAGWISGGLVSAAIVSVLNRRKYAIRERGLLMLIEDLEDRWGAAIWRPWFVHGRRDRGEALQGRKGTECVQRENVDSGLFSEERRC